jgi:hypothetical protein
MGQLVRVVHLSRLAGPPTVRNTFGPTALGVNLGKNLWVLRYFILSLCFGIITRNKILNLLFCSWMKMGELLQLGHAEFKTEKVNNLIT